MSALPTPANQARVLLEGCAEVETPRELEARIAQKQRLSVKFGIDPTGSELHLGHAVELHKMQQFVEFGHRAMLLIGDFTARIGDPTGRNESRPPLSAEQISENMQTYREQAGKVIDLERVEVAYNSEWLARLNFVDVVSLSAKSTVAQMLARNDFSVRYAEHKPIYIHELLYPLAQGYDSVAMQCDVELGGSDQYFNLLLGRELQKSAGQEPQICMTLPILEGTDGVIRMGKSRGNYIGLTESAPEQFGKLMSIPDELIPRYAALAAFLPEREVAALRSRLAAGTAPPMEEKKRLAESIVARYHGPEAARGALERFEATVQRREIPENVPEKIIGPVRNVAEMLVAAQLASSKREAERLVRGGGVKLDGAVCSDASLPWTAVVPVVVSVGTRRFVRVLSS